MTSEKLVAKLRKQLDLPPAAFPVFETANEKAVLNKPGHCPFCDSDDISSGDWDGGPFDTTCTVTCGACQGTWVECYHLKGAFNFTEGVIPDAEEEDEEESTPEAEGTQAHDPDAGPGPQVGPGSDVQG